MANKLYEETDIQNIADAIREKTGSDATMTVSQMAMEIEGISGGGLVGTELTQAEYDALPEEEKNNGLYFITDGVYEGKTFKLVDTITYTGEFTSNVSTNRPSNKMLSVNVDKLSPNAFAILEHTVNRDWAIVNLTNLDRVNLGVWINYYNYYSDTLTGTITVRIYDIV